MGLPACLGCSIFKRLKKKGAPIVRITVLICLLCVLFVSVPPVFCQDTAAGPRLEFYSKAVKDDYAGFYLDGGNLLRLGAVLGISGFMANSAADREVREYYQGDIRSRATDGVSSGARPAGDLFIMAPILMATELYFDRANPYGDWASKSLRALALGGPAGLVIQKATGGGRPSEGDSHWRAFDDNNGLSGHAFVGAVPLITAARMQDDLRIKALLYAASFLPAISRINDDQHYASQAVAGWYLAYACATSIDRQPEDDNEMSFFIFPLGREGFVGRFTMHF